MGRSYGGAITGTSMTNEHLYKKGLTLEYFTVGYNLLEAFASIFFGYIGGSIALVGFGLDSIVESLSGFVLIWRLKKHGTLSPEEELRAEKRAVKSVALTFFALGIYVLYEAVRKLVSGEVPEASAPGLVIALLSLIVMPILAVKKRRLGLSIGSAAMVADARETLACAFLSLALLFGLGANYAWGLWQADPAAALIISAFLFHEGYETWRESREEEE
jgi:cation diffusion facilitator family transporter